MKIFFSLLIFISSLTSLQAQNTRLVEKHAIKAIRQQSNEAYQRYDLDAIAACWHDDIVILPASGTLLQGIEMIKNYLSNAYLKTPDIYFFRKTKKLKLSDEGTLAWETGTWRSYRPKTPDASTFRGEYVAIWEKRAGKWKMRSQVFMAF